MNVSLLSGSDMSIGSAAFYAVIGFMVVLAVLLLLVGIFYLSGFIFRTKALSGEKLFDFKKKDKARAAAEAASDEDEGEVIAAISAAISVMLSQETGEEKPDFVIRRVTRK